MESQHACFIANQLPPPLDVLAVQPTDTCRYPLTYTDIAFGLSVQSPAAQPVACIQFLALALLHRSSRSAVSVTAMQTNTLLLLAVVCFAGAGIEVWLSSVHQSMNSF